MTEVALRVWMVFLSFSKLQAEGLARRGALHWVMHAKGGNARSVPAGSRFRGIGSPSLNGSQVAGGDGHDLLRALVSAGGAVACNGG